MPWVTIMPSIFGSCKWGRIFSASFFQFGKNMSSDAFMNGDSIFVMLQIWFIQTEL